MRASEAEHPYKEGERTGTPMGGASQEQHNCPGEPKPGQMTRQKATEALWETGTQQKLMTPEALNINN